MPDGQIKLIQLWGTYQVGDYNPGVFAGGFAGLWWGAYISLESGNVLQESISIPSINNWHLCEMILEQSTVDTADGNVTIAVDGVVRYEQLNTKTRVNVGESWQNMTYFYGYTNGLAELKTSAIDNTYLNNSWSRVIVGNASTLANSTVRELCIPSAWSDTEITVAFNQGAFTSGDTAYIFVVDSAGVASDGYEITIGGSGTTITASLTGNIQLSGGITI